MAETWVFKNENLSDYEFKNFTVNFTCNGVRYTSMYNADPDYGDWWFEGNGNRVDVSGLNYYGPYILDEYRTIVLDNPATGELLTWLQANAVKQVMLYSLTYSGRTDADLDFYIDGTSVRVASTDPAKTVEASHIKLEFQDDPRTVTVNGQVVYDEFGWGEYEFTLVADTTISLGFDNVIEYVAAAGISLDLSTIGLHDGTHSIQLKLSDDGLTKVDGDLSEAVEYAVSSLDPVMSNNDWPTIFAAFKAGNAPDTWAVGDTKSMTLTDGTTYTIRLCDRQAGRYQYSDGSGSSKAVFEFVELVKIGTTTKFKMNTESTNADGWKGSYMRATTMPQIEAMLPAGVLDGISEANVLSGTGNSTTSGTSSSANKLFIPAEMELFSSRTFSIGKTECPLGQFDYYKAHNTNAYRVKREVGTTTAYYYWLRSSYSGSPTAFCYVHENGSVTASGASATQGIAPIFAI